MARKLDETVPGGKYMTDKGWVDAFGRPFKAPEPEKPAKAPSPKPTAKKAASKSTKKKA